MSQELNRFAHSGPVGCGAKGPALLACLQVLSSAPACSTSWDHCFEPIPPVYLSLERSLNPVPDADACLDRDAEYAS